MLSSGRCMLLLALLAVFAAAPGLPQGEAKESTDTVSEEIDLLRQLNDYGLTVDQLKALLPILQEVETKRQALADYKHSEEALGPMRALREALAKGGDSTKAEEAAQPVWDKLEELDTAVEEALPAASKKVAALLTDEQLATLSQGDDQAYGQADELFGKLESARKFNDETYNAWRDRTAREIAFRAAGESEEKGKQVQTGLQEFLDKVRKLKDDQFLEQSDELFDELTTLLAEAQPKPIREVAEAQAADQLEYLVRSERTFGVVQAMVKARGG